MVTPAQLPQRIARARGRRAPAAFPGQSLPVVKRDRSADLDRPSGSPGRPAPAADQSVRWLSTQERRSRGPAASMGRCDRTSATPPPRRAVHGLPAWPGSAGTRQISQPSPCPRHYASAAQASSRRRWSGGHYTSRGSRRFSPAMNSKGGWADADGGHSAAILLPRLGAQRSSRHRSAGTLGRAHGPSGATMLSAAARRAPP